jgi:hypothetical protein
MTELMSNEMDHMDEREGVQSGSWKIEPGTQITPDGAGEIVAVIHERNAPIYVQREDLPDLIGALMLFLGIEKIEASG